MVLKNVFCISLEAATYIIGILMTLLSFTGIIVTSVYLHGKIQENQKINNDLLEGHLTPVTSPSPNPSTTSHYHDEADDNYDLLRRSTQMMELFISLLVMLLLLFIASILMIYGVRTGKRVFMLPWIIVMVIGFIYTIVVATPDDPAILFIFPFAIIAYVWQIIYSIFIKIYNSKRAITRLDNLLPESNVDIPRDILTSASM